MIKLLILAASALKLGKVGLTGGTMLLALWAYAQVWGWPYAAGFVGLLFVHEMGHVLAARVRGVAVSAPAFIPFMGAFITLKDRHIPPETEAYIAYGGPFLGSLGAFAVYFYGQATGEPLMIAIAYAGFVLNLFNLLPVSPLDGGRITGVLGPRVWLIGAPLLLGLMVWRPSPILFVILLLSIPQLRRAWSYDPRAPENAAYAAVPVATKVEYGVLYLALAIVLALVALGAHERLAAYRLDAS